MNTSTKIQNSKKFKNCIPSFFLFSLSFHLPPCFFTSTVENDDLRPCCWARFKSHRNKNRLVYEVTIEIYCLSLFQWRPILSSELPRMLFRLKEQSIMFAQLLACDAAITSSALTAELVSLKVEETAYYLRVCGKSWKIGMESLPTFVKSGLRDGFNFQWSEMFLKKSRRIF